MRSFLFLANLLDTAYVGPQSFECTDHDFLLFSCDSREQSRLKLTVCRTEPDGYRMLGSRQGDKSVAIILRVEATVEHSVDFCTS
jgi:hypothetical protein